MKIFQTAVAVVSCSALVGCSVPMPEMQNPPQTAQECAEYARDNTNVRGAVAPGAGLGANIFLAIAAVTIGASAQASREKTCLESIGLTGQDSVSPRTRTSGLSGSAITYNSQVQALNFTPDEQRIWDTLDEEQRRRAVEFIRNGGTLIGSLGDD